MLCSNSIDTIGKKCRNRGEHIYLYKKKARILPLAFVDDLNGISKCGKESLALNIFLTTQIELKKLKFHVPDKSGKTKCHKMHIGRKSESCPTLKVHGTIMPEVTEDVYLGDIISCDGKNTKNVKSRISKGLGIINQIFNLLENITFGCHFFETALLLRDSMLLNGSLTNSEIWYNFSAGEVEEFESLDRLFFRRLLETPVTTPTESYYLEFGILPVSIVIKARRINYLHSILKKDKKGMVFSFFITQWYSPSPGDWTEQVRQDLNDFNIPCSFDLIESKSAEAFKSLVKKKAKEFAFKELLNKKAKHSKMDNLSYSKYNLQEYFLSYQTSNNQKRLIFKYRTKMERFGENYRGGKTHVMCPVCKLHYDNQDLVLQCPEVRKNIPDDGNMKELYSETINTDIVETLTKVMKFRTTKIENEC